MDSCSAAITVGRWNGVLLLVEIVLMTIGEGVVGGGSGSGRRSCSSSHGLGRSGGSSWRVVIVTVAIVVMMGGSGGSGKCGSRSSRVRVHVWYCNRVWVVTVGKFWGGCGGGWGRCEVFIRRAERLLLYHSSTSGLIPACKPSWPLTLFTFYWIPNSNGGNCIPRASIRV